jgi:hypothetical protein
LPGILVVKYASSVFEGSEVDLGQEV